MTINHYINDKVKGGALCDADIDTPLIKQQVTCVPDAVNCKMCLELMKK